MLRPGPGTRGDSAWVSATTATAGQAGRELRGTCTDGRYAVSFVTGSVGSFDRADALENALRSCLGLPTPPARIKLIPASTGRAALRAAGRFRGFA